MGIPLYIFYFIYLALVAVFIFFLGFNVYILLRFGFFTVINLLLALLFVGVSLTILTISWQSIGQIDWKQSIPILMANNFPY